MPEPATRAWTPEGTPLRSLAAALGVPPARVITFVGAGGKTTLVHALARDCAAAGLRVVVATTTRMTVEPGMATSVEEALERLHAPAPAPVVVGLPEGGKFGGVGEEGLGRLRAASDVLVIEGDGSRRLPFKVPAPHEPVVPPCTDLLVVVAGLTALGRPVADVCCRAELTVTLLGDPDAAARTLDPATAAALLRAGYLDAPRLAPWRGRRAIVLNQADDAALARRGRAVAAGIAGERVVLTTTNQNARNRL